ncbi:MAG TPA: MmcQ/YjbR family DNA-binding protein [Rhodothermales bacterium]|nr:MmcQ/YjbR family DNA-binding protein [Rhodothermales bacterium]
MTIDAIRDYCLAKDGVSEGFPFGEQALVFKVGSKMFALLNLAELPTSINLKCDPERSIVLRERYESVRPGYHMNKTHWNTVLMDGSIPTAEVREMIDHSYHLVATALPRAERREIFGA